MNRRDKEKLIMLGFLLGFIVLTVLLMVGTRYVQPIWIGVAVLVIQYIVLLPVISKKYHQLYNYKPTADRFIPVWNEVSLFPELYSKLSLATYAVAVVCLALLFVPSEYIAKVFGEYFMFQWGTLLIRIDIIVLVANTIITAIGYLKIVRSINAAHSDIVEKGVTLSKVEVIFNILLFIPLLRVLSLGYYLDRLNKIVSLNSFSLNPGDAVVGE